MGLHPVSTKAYKVMAPCASYTTTKQTKQNELKVFLFVCFLEKGFNLRAFPQSEFQLIWSYANATSDAVLAIKTFIQHNINACKDRSVNSMTVATACGEKARCSTVTTPAGGLQRQLLSSLQIRYTNLHCSHVTRHHSPHSLINM